MPDLAPLSDPLARLLRLVLTAAAVLALLACGGEPTPPADTATETAASTPAGGYSFDLPAGAEEAAGQITADYLREVVAHLSDDALAGRGPGTAGDEAARSYIREQLAGFGLAPGGVDGSWEQPFDIVSLESHVPKSWSFTAGGEQVELKFWDEFIAVTGVQQPTAAIDDAELVFVGYGIEAPEYQWDDYKGADLTGKVLVMLNNDPEWDPQLFEGERRLYYGRWTYKYESAARQGAAAAIIIHTDASAGYGWQVVQTSWTGVQYELPAGPEPRLQVAGWTTSAAMEKLLALSDHQLPELVEAAKQRDFHPVPLGIRTSLSLQNDVHRGVKTANVLGLLRGSDPELAEQVVIYTGHHDHLGVGEPNAAGDEIYNGARDNASGVAVMLAIARAMSALPEPPRRSILFAAVAAEEQGLLGSKYFALHPTVPAGRLVGAVNFDSANIFGRTQDVTFIGRGKSSLDQVVDAAAAAQDRVVKGDQFPDRGFFYRSDQFSLAKIGVPAIYVSSGTELRDGRDGRQLIDDWTGTHYHQPSDELTAEWSFEGMVEDAQLGYYCGLAIAEDDEIPTWNPGDEFEEARQQALAALDGE